MVAKLLQHIQQSLWAQLDEAFCYVIGWRNVWNHVFCRHYTLLFDNILLPLWGPALSKRYQGLFPWE